MTGEKEVCSIILAHRLQTLGVKQESRYYWRDNDGFEESSESDYSIASYINPSVTKWYASAFTARELGDLLPPVIYIEQIPYRCGTSKKYRRFVFYTSKQDKHFVFYESSEADALARMLITLLED